MNTTLFNSCFNPRATMLSTHKDCTFLVFGDSKVGKSVLIQSLLHEYQPNMYYNNNNNNKITDGSDNNDMLSNGSKDISIPITRIPSIFQQAFFTKSGVLTPPTTTATTTTTTTTTSSSSFKTLHKDFVKCKFHLKEIPSSSDPLYLTTLTNEFVNDVLISSAAASSSSSSSSSSFISSTTNFMSGIPFCKHIAGMIYVIKSNCLHSKPHLIVDTVMSVIKKKSYFNTTSIKDNIEDPSKWTILANNYDEFIQQCKDELLALYKQEMVLYTKNVHNELFNLITTPGLQERPLLIVCNNTTTILDSTLKGIITSITQELQYYELNKKKKKKKHTEQLRNENNDGEVDPKLVLKEVFSIILDFVISLTPSENSLLSALHIESLLVYLPSQNRQYSPKPTQWFLNENIMKYIKNVEKSSRTSGSFLLSFQNLVKLVYRKNNDSTNTNNGNLEANISPCMIIPWLDNKKNYKRYETFLKPLSWINYNNSYYFESTKTVVTKPNEEAEKEEEEEEEEVTRDDNPQFVYNFTTPSRFSVCFTWLGDESNESLCLKTSERQEKFMKNMNKVVNINDDTTSEMTATTMEEYILNWMVKSFILMHESNCTKKIVFDLI